MSVVHMVASGKGGTGKTMFSVNLGATYANQGKKVVVIDLDMGQRNLDLYFGLESNVVYDAYDFMKGICSMEQALVRDTRFEELYIMGASPEKTGGEITEDDVRELCEKLKEEFDYIIIDCPSGTGEGIDLAASDADSAIIVATPEYASLRDADITDSELLRKGIRNRFLVLNKLSEDLMTAGFIPSLSEITNMMRPELIGIIQTDENINISTNLGVPIVMKEDTYIRQNFESIANRLNSAVQ